jgi:serine/threonine-protein kinase RsbW
MNPKGHAMTAQVELVLRGPMDHLRLTWQAGETLLESVPFREDPEGTRYNTLLAIQEIVTNVLRHAYQGDEQQPIHVEFEAAADRFTVRVRDRGERFDPRSHTFSRPDTDEMPSEGGGYGIMIATMVMDTIDYEWDGVWNTLTMTKFVRTPIGARLEPLG